MLSCISLRTALHHTISIHFNFLASHCTAPFSTAQATGIHWQHWHFGGFLPTTTPAAAPAAAHHHPSSRPSSRPPAAAPAAAHRRPSIFLLISRPFYPPMAARGGLGGFLPYYRPFQSFSSYLDHIRGLRLTGGFLGGFFAFMGVYRGV
jgi:hypothetical protein